MLHIMHESGNYILLIEGLNVQVSNMTTSKSHFAYTGPPIRPYVESPHTVYIFFRACFNSHPVMTPYMTPFSNALFKVCNFSWGWPSGIDRILSLVRNGFETACNIFFVFALALITQIPL